MKRINKSSVLSLFCAFVMLLSLCLIPSVKSEAAAKAPAIDKSIVMFRNSYNRTIRIKNMKKGDVITKAVPKGNDYSIVSAYTSDEHYNEILVNTFNSSKSGKDNNSMALSYVYPDSANIFAFSSLVFSSNTCSQLSGLK